MAEFVRWFAFGLGCLFLVALIIVHLVNPSWFASEGRMPRALFWGALSLGMSLGAWYQVTLGRWCGVALSLLILADLALGLPRWRREGLARRDYVQIGAQAVVALVLLLLLLSPIGSQAFDV